MQNGEHLLSNEKISKAVAKLAIPAVLSTLVSMIYNLTDTYFIGLLRNTAQLSAVSLAMPVMWLFSALSGILAAGAPQLISLKMGENDRAAASRCRSFCVFGTLALSALLTPVALLANRPLLRLMGADGDVLIYALEYLTIIAAATVFSATGGAFQGVLRAGGQATRASASGIAGIVTNIVLDPLFILALRMGMRGAALATALGSVVSMAVGGFFARKDVSVRRAVPARQEAARILKLSLASTCSSLITVVTMGCSFGLASGLGGGLVASISVCAKLYSVVVSLAAALAYSMQPLTGYNYASGNFPRLRRGILVSLGIGSVICFIGAALFLLCGEAFMRVFTDDPEVIASGAKVLRFMAISTPLASLQMTANAYLSATGKVVRSLISALGRQLIVFVPALILLYLLMGFDGIVLSYPLSDVVSTVIALALCAPDFRKVFSTKKKL